MPTASYLAIHERASWARASKYSSKGIYEAVKAAIKTKVRQNNEENRILQKFSIEGKLNGLELDDTKRIILAECVQKINNEKKDMKKKTGLCNTSLFSYYK